MRRSLARFVRGAWDVVEPETPLVWGWHIDAICDHLQAVSDGRIRRLLINVPPGHMKSLLVCVFWPAWVWLRRPSWRALFGSYAAELSMRDSVRCRELVSSAWYRDTFEPPWQLKKDNNRQSMFENDASGLRMALTVGGKGTGFRGDAIVFDDPLNVKAWYSAEELHKARFWWFNRMSSRLNDKRVDASVGIMQRVHDGDLSAECLKQGGYVHLCLPTEFVPSRRCKTPIFEDPRREAGELLFPQRFTRGVVGEAKATLGEYGFAAQEQQDPVPAGGGMVKESWLDFYGQAPEPSAFSRVVASWDCAVEANDGSSFVVGQVWGELRAGDVSTYYLLDQMRERAGIIRTIAMMRRCWRQHPYITQTLIEKKANGAPIVQALRGEFPGIIPIVPSGAKEARLAAVSPLFESAAVKLPSHASWLAEYVDELVRFPKGVNDDQVDATTQALLHLRGDGTKAFAFRF